MGEIGARVGDLAPDFSLQDQNGKTVTLKDLLKKGPALLVFYPGDFTMVCTKQLCNYRDNMEQFEKHGVQIVGLSNNPPMSHAAFSSEFKFVFPLLTDSNHTVAKKYGCSSLLMFGGISRSVFVVSRSGKLEYRYVEPTVLSRRKADELISIVQELEKKGKLA